MEVFFIHIIHASVRETDSCLSSLWFHLSVCWFDGERTYFKTLLLTWQIWAKGQFHLYLDWFWLLTDHAALSPLMSRNTLFLKSEWNLERKPFCVPRTLIETTARFKLENVVSSNVFKSLEKGLKVELSVFKHFNRCILILFYFCSVVDMSLYEFTSYWRCNCVSLERDKPGRVKVKYNKD